jgi:hypothetical protein
VHSGQLGPGSDGNRFVRRRQSVGVDQVEYAG